MGELIHIMTAAPNLPITLLFVLMVGYWGSVIVGAVSMDSLNVDLGGDASANVDVDVGADVSGDVDAGGAEFDKGALVGGGGGSALGGFFQGSLMFVNAHYIPLSIILSIFLFVLFTLTIITARLFNQEATWLMAAALFIPNYLVSIFATKLATVPFVPFFKAAIDEDRRHRSILGMSCRTVSPCTDTRIGQAKIDSNGAPLLLNVRTREGHTADKSSDAVILEFDAERNTYIIEPIPSREELQ